MSGDSGGVSALAVRAARAAGRLAAAGGLPVEACPYAPDEHGGVSPQMRAFVYGFRSAESRR